MEQMIASWSMVMVHALMVVGSSGLPRIGEIVGPEIDDPRMSRAVPSGRREGMFLGRYSEIFGRGERLGCILNLGHSFDAIEAYLWIC